MALTAAQQAAVKADILANPDLNAFPDTADGAWAIADLYNLAADPAFVVWRSSVPTSDVMEALDWTEMVAASVGERDTFRMMIADGNIDATNANVRSGLQDIFSGPGGAQSRANLTAIAKRNASVVEQLFATGDGTDGSPATMTFEGNISYQDVLAARNS